MLYICMYSLWFSWKENQFPHCTVTKSTWRKQKMDCINVQCTLRGRMDIESFLWSPTSTERKKTESSQVVSIIAPVRTSSKAHTCNHPTPVWWQDAVGSGGESDVMIIPNISDGLSVFPLCEISSIYLLPSACVFTECNFWYGPLLATQRPEVLGESASFNSSKQIDSGLAKAPLWWHKTNNTQLPGWLQPIRLQDMLRRIEIREGIGKRQTQRMCAREHWVLWKRERGGRPTDRKEDVCEKGELAEQHSEKQANLKDIGKLMQGGNVFMCERQIHAYACF